MSLKTQAKVLRALDEQRFLPVGASHPVHVDVRVIAATNKDLEEEIARGNFREDLFYRLNVIPFFVPPLRDRKEDIPPLVEHFLTKFSRENEKFLDPDSKSLLRFEPDALQLLMDYNWPGNVRELENAVERAVVLCEGQQIEKKHLPPSLVPSEERGGPPPIPGSTIADLERYAILKTLEACGGSTSKAATVLGVSPRKIQYKLHEYGAPGGEEEP